MWVEGNLLFAFGFASPWLLGGLTLVCIPILIHLLTRRRYRETPWAAMRFLLEAARKDSRRIRLEQLVLLAVRVLLLALLSLALARPIAESFDVVTQSVAPVHRILVIDASFSMGRQEGGSSRFERAQALARKIAGASRPGDALNLARICGHSSAVIVREPSRRADQVLSEIDQLRVSQERGDVAACLRDVAELASLAPEIAHKEIYLLSDFQRENWQPDAADGQSNVRRLLAKLAESAEITILDIKEEQGTNTAVISFDSEEPVPIVGRNVPLHAVLKNFGDKPLPSQKVELYIDGKLSETRSVALPPAADVPVEFNPLFRDGGDHRLEVRLESDALAIDNRRFLVLPVREELRVLLVNGRPSGRPIEAATYYLETVLSPSTSRETWTGSTRPRVIGDGELAEQDLSRFDCVCLCDVRIFTDREAAILQSYAEAGGGVIFWLGDRVQPENYNQLLYRNGKGILPALLNQRVGNAKDQADAFVFDATHLEHPMLGRFRGNPGTGLETTLTFAYIRATVENEKPVQSERSAQVVLRFQNGDPAIVESAIGRGRAVLVATSADLSWGTWPVQRSFPPLVHEMVRFAIAGRLGERLRQVGEPIMRSLPARERPSSITVTRPDGQAESVAVMDTQNEAAAIVYDKTDRSGIYEMRFGPPTSRAEQYAVNLDSRESDLAAFTAEQVQSGFLAGAGRPFRNDWQQPERALENTATAAELSGWLLAAVLCLVFVEQLMAWNFSYGLLLLYACVAAGFVRHAFAWNTLAGMAALTVFTAGFAVLVILQRRRTGSSSDESSRVRV